MTLHLLHHTYRGQRGWLWMFWLLCALQAMAGAMNSGADPVQLGRTLIFVGQCFAGAFALVLGIHAHPVASSNAFWLTRPLTRPQVLGAGMLHVFGLVMLPLLGSLAVGLSRAGFTGAQLGAVILQWLLFIGVFVTIAAAIAGHTRNVAQFFAVMGGTMGFMFVAAALFNYFVDRARMLNQLPGSWTPEAEASSLLVALILVIAGTLASWMVRALSSGFAFSLPTAAIPLLLFLLLTMLRPFDFLTQADRRVVGASVELVTETGIDEAKGPDEQLLWSHFRVSGLAEDSLAVPAALNAWFRTTNGFRVLAHYFPQRHDSFGINRIKSSPARGAVMDILRRQYPAETVWSGNWFGHSQNHLPLSTSGEIRWPKNPVGEFSGMLQAGIVQMKRIADVPVKPAVISAGEGFGISILSVSDEPDGLQLRIQETAPSLKFSRTEEFRGSRYWEANCLYILHHAASGEAHLADNGSTHSRMPTFLNNQKRVTLRLTVPRSRLRERLTGHGVEDWLSGLRLHVYRARETGALDHRFENRDYLFAQNRLAPRRRAQDTQSGLEKLKQMAWPGAKDSAAAQNFAHDFLKHAPDRYHGNQGREVTKILTDIGPEIVPFLLREAPFPEVTENMVLRTFLTRTVLREHLPELTAALERDPSLAWLLRSKRWEKEGVDALAKSLPDRERPLTADALIVLAEHAQPEQFADLGWHAARCRSGQEHVFRELRGLKGFPYTATVREAWKRARLGFVSQAGVAVYAAELGELDGLHAVIRQLDTEGDNPRRQRTMEILGDKLDFKGDTDSAADWLLKHANQLKYDAERRIYVRKG